MKLWSGRFEKDTDKLADEFNSSLNIDKRLYKYDILGSIAHCTMLGEQGIISSAESQNIISGLKSILEDIENGKLIISDAEDIHMFVESELTKRIGSDGKKLHTARSRNDQVALDIRMYMKESIDHTKELIKNLIETLLKISSQNLDTIMSGFTHMQKAQPVTLAHYLNAYACMFLRDIERFSDCKKRINVMPLGSGALAGTTYPINRLRVAELLGFEAVTLNSLDAVSDRDFAIEYASCASMLMMHISKISEEWIYWASDEFGYIALDDRYCTGSSIMPQKKNPDMLELTRGKTSRVYGNLMTLLTLTKALPLAYNKDLQEDKEAIFDIEDTINTCIKILTAVIDTAVFNKEKMLASALGGYSAATDIADYLAKKGLPFRDAHRLTGEIVLHCVKRNTTLESLSYEDYKKFSDIFQPDIMEAVKLENVVGNRNVIGGTAPAAAAETIKKLKEALDKI